MRLHRSGSLRALTAEAGAELTDTLDVSALLISQDNVVQILADCVHDSILPSVGQLESGGIQWSREGTTIKRPSGNWGLILFSRM